MSNLAEKKFWLPSATIVIGAVMVPFDYLKGNEWAMMSTTLISGFYAVKAWYVQSGARREMNDGP